MAAALYGAGARLDAEPELLFRLRETGVGWIFANLDAALPASRGGGAGTRLDTGDLADIFGIDMAAPSPAARGKASKSAKPSPADKISRPEAGEGKKANRAGPAKPPRAPQSPATVEERARGPGRRAGQKRPVRGLSRAAVASATAPRKRRVTRKTVRKKSAVRGS